MATMLLAILVMALIVGGMAIGVIFGRKPIKGSCGGLNAVGVQGDCEICGGNPNKCESVSSTGDSNTEMDSSLASNAVEKQNRH